MAKKIKSHCTDGMFFDHTVVNFVHNANNNSNNVDDIIKRLDLILLILHLSVFIILDILIIA